MSEQLLLTGTLDPSQELTYIYVPFEVPIGVVRIDVEYSYSDPVGSDPHLTGGNTVDIGIFDSRGTDFLGEGFRGWSGSARTEFYVGIEEATPGYLAGPIQDGTWHICLGLYKLSDDGCDYRIEIIYEFDDGKDAEFAVLLPLSSDVRPERRSDTGWYKGELHCHTYHSDGDSDPVELIKQAEGLGLDFLAITDHNVRSAQSRMLDLDTPLILIPGMEVTTYNGHWNVWGDGEWIDFRILSAEQMEQTIAIAKERGFLTSCNHPKQFGPDWKFKAVGNFDCVEIWNGPWMLFNQEALAFWEQKLRSGKRYPVLGGSDAHFLKRDHIAQIGSPTTWIYCDGEPSAQLLVENMRAGHMFITSSLEGPELYLNSGEAMMGDCIRKLPGNKLPVEVEVIGGNGSVLELRGASGLLFRSSIQQAVVKVHVELDTNLYVRAQLVDGQSPPAEVLALTNPIYLIEDR